MEGWLIVKVLGIITEYNPFHNGHKYHIEEAKKITGADYLIAVMSGDFVQRGSPAITSKYNRSMMALNNGVDLVLELPVCYSTGSAQYFALGAVSLLNQLGIVDYLCFGSECGDIALLEEAANLFYNPTKSFNETLSTYIREGLSYPAARAKAANHLLKMEQKDNTHELCKIISEPNNILGIEYIMALAKVSSTIKPLTITRQKAHYHDTNLGKAEYDEGVISSATAIRGIMQEVKDISALSSIKSSVPKSVFDYFKKDYLSTFPITLDDFSAIIKYLLLSQSSHALAEYLDLSPDLADRIKNIDIQNYSISELIQMFKTKNITLTRVNRALIHVLLNIKKTNFQEYLDDKIIYYARILGMKKEASHLLRMIKKNSDISLITKVSTAYKQLDFLGMRMLNQDIFATHLYNQVVYEKYKTIIPNEYKHGISIL